MPRPHKCPCCDGRGQRMGIDQRTSAVPQMEPCRPCSGIGIVWEPTPDNPGSAMLPPVDWTAIPKFAPPSSSGAVVSSNS